MGAGYLDIWQDGVPTVLNAQQGTFASLLRSHRTAAGLTQEELAERANLSVRAISDLERGLKRKPYRTTLQQLARALELSEAERTAFEVSGRGQRGRGPAWPTGGTHAGPPRTELIGRDVELATLTTHVEGQGPPVLMVSGEPGIGKSRLLQEAIRVGDAMGVPVLFGGCHRRSASEPYAPLVTAISTYIEQQSPRALRALLDGCTWLVRLLPELTGTMQMPLPVGAPRGDQERRLLFASTRRFLANVSGTRGAVLVLDDLQWAGTDALDLLLVVVQSIHESGLRVVVAYRDTDVEAADPCAIALADLAQAELVRQLPLAPLRRGDAMRLFAAITAGRVEAEEAEIAAERCGGVPFFLTSYAHAWQEETGDASDLPWSIEQSVRQRVAMLPDECQNLIGSLAVAGRSAPRALLRTVLGVGAEEFERMLDVLGRAGLLRDEETHVMFFHDIVRDVVETSVGSGRRRTLHRRIAHELMCDQEPGAAAQFAEIAWHVRAGGEPAVAAGYLIRAGDAAGAVYAHYEAERHYLLATELAMQADDVRTEAAAQEKLGRVRLTTGKFREAQTALVRAVDLYHMCGDAQGGGRTGGVLGWIYYLTMQPVDGIAHLTGLAQELDRDEPPSEVGYLYVSLSLLLYGHDSPAGLRAAERAAEVARRHGDDKLLAQAEVRRGLALGSIGRWDEAANVLERSIPLVERFDDGRNLQHALDFAGIAVRIVGRPTHGLEYQRRALQVAERHEDVAEIGYHLSQVALGCFISGRWSEAREKLDRALSIDHTVTTHNFSATYAQNLLQLNVMQGKWADVSTGVERILALVPTPAPDAVQRNCDFLLAEMDLLAGFAQAAMQRVDPWLQESYLHEQENIGASGTPVEVCLAMGDVERAAALAERFHALVTWQKNRLRTPEAWRLQAKVKAARGDSQGAEELFSQAVSLAAALPFPFEHARALFDWGLLCLTGGRKERAHQLLMPALTIFRLLEAQPFVDQLERALQGANEQLDTTTGGGISFIAG